MKDKDITFYEFRFPEVGELLKLSPYEEDEKTLKVRLIKAAGNYVLLDCDTHTSVKFESHYSVYESFGSISELMRIVLRKYRIESLDDRSVFIVRERDERI